MLLSEFIKKAQDLVATHGDAYLLDGDDFEITRIDFDTITKAQAEYWGDPAQEGETYFKIGSNK